MTIRDADIDPSYAPTSDGVAIAGRTAWYRRINLSLVLHRGCDAVCPFCVADLPGGHAPGRPVDDSAWFGGLDALWPRMEGLSPSVSITGGEPTISPRFERSLAWASGRSPWKWGFTTNGSGLRDGRVLDAVVRHRPTYANLSRHHPDDVVNAGIMGPRMPSTADLARIVAATTAATAWRVNAVLTAGVLDTDAATMDHVRWAADLGIRTVSFRYPTGAALRPWISANGVVDRGVERAWMARAEPVAVVVGPFYRVRVLRWNGSVVLFDDSHMRPDPAVVRAEQEAFGVDRVVHELVWTHAGRLCDGWDGLREAPLP